MPADRLDTYLFDLDGTLIDSIELIMSSYRHTLLTHRGSAPDDDVWLAGLGTPLWVQFRRFTDDPAEIAAMVDTYREHNLRHHDEMVRPYPGVHEALEALAARGVRLAIVTSKLRAGTLRGLARCGFEDLFELLVCADDVERHKPDPEPVLTALERLAADARRSVFIGDSPHDLAAGRAAGVRTGAALWGPFPRRDLEPHEPDHWLAAPSAIATLDGRWA